MEDEAIYGKEMIKLKDFPNLAKWILPRIDYLTKEINELKRVSKTVSFKKFLKAAGISSPNSAIEKDNAQFINELAELNFVIRILQNNQTMELIFVPTPTEIKNSNKDKMYSELGYTNNSDLIRWINDGEITVYDKEGNKFEAIEFDEIIKTLTKT